MSGERSPEANAALTGSSAELIAQLAAARQRSEQLEASIASLKNHLAEVEGSLKSRDSGLSLARDIVRTRETELAQLQATLDGERSELARVRAELRNARRRIDTLEKIQSSWVGLFRSMGHKFRMMPTEMRQVARRTAEANRIKRDAILITQAGLFDEPWYLKQNPDVAEAGLSPLVHYLCHGWLEGRDPSATFSTKDYLALHDDVVARGLNPLVHYAKVGRLEGRKVKVEA